MNKTNNKNSVWNEPFFMVRKVNRCYSNAISFITDKFMKILKLALPVFTLASIALTTIMYFFCDAELQINIASTIYFNVFAVLTLYFITSLIIAFVYRCIDINIEGLNIYSIGYVFFYNRIFLNKLLKALIVNFVLFAFVTLFLVGAQFVTGLFFNQVFRQVDVQTEQMFVYKWIAIIIIAALLIALTIPWHMALNNVMFKNINIFNNMFSGYKMGWKKWGKIFALDLMTTITIVILVLFVISPAYVISLMQHSATLSRLQGDAVEIPQYFAYITIAILFVSSFFLNLLFTFKYLPQAYLYSSLYKELNIDDENKII